MSMVLLGATSAINRLNKIRKVTNGKALLKALQEIGERITGDTKRIIKHKNIVDTGRLMGSITYSIGGRQYGFEPVTDSEASDQVDKNKRRDEVIIGTNVEYAASHEFGSVKGIQPRPYLSVAFNHNKQAASDIMKREILYEITKATSTGIGVIK